MADYTDIITRGSATGQATDALVPQPVAAQIIQQLPASSAVLQLARRVPMSSKTNRLPVLSTLPEAYFVTGDTGLKQASKQAWENVTLVAEELAVIVPVPIAYMDDAQVPLWDEIRPRISAAFGKKLDQATLFGLNKPETWGSAIVPAAVTAGNHVAAGTNDDLAADFAEVAQEVAEDGYEVNGVAVQAGFHWRLVGMRTSQGIPIYSPSVAADQPSTLYGTPLAESRNGAWDSTDALAIAGDWNYAILGVRQDISFQVFNEGVISDDAGAIVLNLMQQDSVAVRAVARFAWAVANPINEVNTNNNTRFPFGVLRPTGS